ncbi:hypothetical protein N7448_009573 [Penicillium atrosanguineum]|uniref:Small ribosomal subunit protein bS18m n=1 Tax=Penicillium atrosanguineum TaxID=1132637 RepID=A0A9W9Q1C2_9EURO|nr:uncharacterized protein N7443_006821 [Penicillium atrosanguineum]KAJ5123476.1 hypothetical protein N7448_009573 [Penicillium atrosanguineum]KAJ5142106.1 hypothetical protein N7526_003101 [Penicillium atrosanguineum]KAJ5298701.1 hypothetical protein N7443_006821 [Penicillium atrosanguineum]KAJ5321033.1 hypothetical protein N7476_004035 [Penicillium atrosanguineum]
MSVNLFSSPLLRSIAHAVPSACRWSSTAAMSAFTSQRATSSQTSKVQHRRRLPNRLRFLEDQKAQGESRALEKFQTREWKAGDVYAPHDLSPAEMKKWGKRKSPSTDAFDALNLNPLHLYKNFSVMSEYVSALGRIRHRDQTGLRPVNQRKIAKAIRRAMGLGLMPSVHRHPEILATELRAKLEGGNF